MITPIPTPPELCAKKGPGHYSVLAFGHVDGLEPFILIIVDGVAAWWNQADVDHLCWENGELSMTPRHATQSLDSATTNLARIHTTIGPAYTTITLMAGDGYPTGSNGPHSTDTADPTLNAVLTKGRELDHTIRIRLRLIAIGLEELATLIDRLQPGKTPAELRAAYERVRCTGQPTQRGPHEWAGRADCTNIATTNGQCDACRLREYRWRKQHEAVA